MGKTTLQRRIKNKKYNKTVDFLEVSFGITADIENSIKLMKELHKQLPQLNILHRDLLQKDPFSISISTIL